MLTEAKTMRACTCSGSLSKCATRMQMSASLLTSSNSLHSCTNPTSVFPHISQHQVFVCSTLTFSLIRLLSQAPLIHQEQFITMAMRNGLLSYVLNYSSINLVIESPFWWMDYNYRSTNLQYGKCLSMTL